MTFGVPALVCVTTRAVRSSRFRLEPKPATLTDAGLVRRTDPRTHCRTADHSGAVQSQRFSLPSTVLIVGNFGTVAFNRPLAP
jgi:hypothetical protein